MKHPSSVLTINNANSLSNIKPIFSLPTLIFIFVALLFAFGFWNMYNRESQKEHAQAIKPNMFESIKQITQKAPAYLNQSVTLGNIRIVEKISNKAFLTSDGESVLLLLVGDNLNGEKISDMIADTPGYLILRGNIRTFDQETIKKYQLQTTDDPLIGKQTIYLEITEMPQYNHKQMENDVFNQRQTI